MQGGTQNERRKDERRAIEMSVHLQAPICCTLSDISTLGARLSVNNPDTLPDEFLLEFNKGLRRWCRVRWRSQSQVGVEFTQPPDVPVVYATTPDSTAADETVSAPATR